MDHYLLAYIRQQMLERGYRKFHHEPVLLLTDSKQTKYQIRAYNEFFFLVSKEIANGTIIRSDNNVYEAGQYYNKNNFHQIQEFTGLIIIEIPKNTIQLLEFIRVIPQ
jgi:hypothetical protein